MEIASIRKNCFRRWHSQMIEEEAIVSLFCEDASDGCFADGGRAVDKD
jgi:hypothetical protein